jgi:hypothetical protein
LGGPLYQLLLRLKLIQPPLDHLAWRIGVITALVWLPLFALAIAGGKFAGGVTVPFIYDFEVHARLLFALPLLVLAELFVYERTRALAMQFSERQIITDALRPAFNEAISTAMRLRNSLLAEIVLLLLVVIVGPHIWRQALALHSDTWYATVSSSSLTYTAAGYWYAFVSIPVFQFILLRWYYRIIIWCYLLFRVSRLDLNLIALHPDRCCGLGFLGTMALSFAPLATAHSGIIAGYIANRILREGATLPDYTVELLGMTVLLLTIGIGPLCIFSPKLNGAKLSGLRIYGTLASDYVASFSEKWAHGATPGSANVKSEPFLGSADIQSLADLANSFTVVKEVKLVPFGKDTVIGFLVAIALPLVPLTLTMFSPDELLMRLVTAIF